MSSMCAAMSNASRWCLRRFSGLPRGHDLVAAGGHALRHRERAVVARDHVAVEERRVAHLGIAHRGDRHDARSARNSALGLHL